MARNRITRGGVAPRASRLPPRQGRRLVALAAAIALLAVLVAGCGGGGGGASTDSSSEKAADVAILNDILSRQLAAVEAYQRTIPSLRGRDQEVARELRAQEQEHADAIVKAQRGLGAESAPEPEAIEAGDLAGRVDRLGFLYDLEGATIDAELSAISKLSAPWPRALLGSIVANQAQHRLLLRQLLGDTGHEPIPNAFEDGTEPSLDEAAE